jgi:hypothetical protein
MPKSRHLYLIQRHFIKLFRIGYAKKKEKAATQVKRDVSLYGDISFADPQIFLKFSR